MLGGFLDAPGMILGGQEIHRKNQMFHEKIEIFHDFACFFECFRFEFVIVANDKVFRLLRGHTRVHVSELNTCTAQWEGSTSHPAR